MRRVLICGSRSLEGSHRVIELVLSFDPTTTTVIHGDARGVDRWAGYCAAAVGCDVVPVPADWKAHGKAAGPIRNQRMLDEEHPDEVFAVVDRPLPESRGTYDMVQRALAAGLPVWVSVEDRPFAQAVPEPSLF